MRSLLSTAIVALVVGAVAGATAGALAQSEPQAAPAASSVNADRVDGKHAVGAGASRTQRAGKLVATDGQGYLPSGILKGPIVKKLTIETVIATKDHDGAVGTGKFVNADCPEGSTMTGGGFSTPGTSLRVIRSNPEGDHWEVGFQKIEADPPSGFPAMRAYAVCLSVTPASGLVISARR